MKFRKKPIVIEAFQNGFDVEPDWFRFNRQVIQGVRDDHGTVYHINTLEGVMIASFGDWIIKGIKGEIYPCKPDIFEMTYEAVPNIPTAEEYFAEAAKP